MLADRSVTRVDDLQVCTGACKVFGEIHGVSIKRTESLCSPSEEVAHRVLPTSPIASHSLSSATPILHRSSFHLASLQSVAGPSSHLPPGPASPLFRHLSAARVASPAARLLSSHCRSLLSRQIASAGRLRFFSSAVRVCEEWVIGRLDDERHALSTLARAIGAFWRG